jgi:hypothetical protein
LKFASTALDGLRETAIAYYRDLKSEEFPDLRQGARKAQRIATTDERGNQPFQTMLQK